MINNKSNDRNSKHFCRLWPALSMTFKEAVMSPSSGTILKLLLEPYIHIKN